MTLSTFADPVPAARPVASSRADTSVVERFIDAVFVRFDADAAARLITPDFVSHPWAALGAPAGPAGVHVIVPFFRTAFDDVSATVLDRLVDGDRVALRYAYAGRHVGDLFGIPATGRHFRIEGIAIFRLEDGRVAEYWREEDMLGLQRQLGVASLLGAWAAERAVQVKEEPAQRAGDTEQNALPPRLLAATDV